MSLTNRDSEMGLFFIIIVEEIIFSKLPYNSMKKVLWPKYLH